MNNEFITKSEPTIFDSYQEFKEWLDTANQEVSFMSASVIGFTTKEETDKFDNAWKISTRYDDGSVKYCKR